MFFFTCFWCRLFVAIYIITPIAPQKCINARIFYTNFFVWVHSLRSCGIHTFGYKLDSLFRYKVETPQLLKFRTGTMFWDIICIFFLKPLKKMHNQEPALYYDASDTYRGPLRSFFGIAPIKWGKKKIILRVLILSTIQKACPTHVPLWFPANHTNVRYDICIKNPETPTA